MHGEYKKITKEDIDFPRYCHFFIKEIDESLKENEINNPGDELDLEIETSTYPYCYEGFELVKKSFERKHFQINIPTFTTKMEDGVKYYIYKWTIRKLSKIDDLPFSN